ncbi:MAG: hypothetical protein P8Y44_12345 [Acidobacteriota bacterium]
MSIRSSASRLDLDEILVRLARALVERPDDIMAWETLALERFSPPLPSEIRSAWIFTLRAGVASGAERHSNSHQRSLAYRGSGEVQTREGDDWQSFPLSSDSDLSIDRRWASIASGVWHQWVVGEEDLTVLSFHTVPADELVEERPAEDGETEVRQMRYADRS